MIHRLPTKPPPPLCRDIFSIGACVWFDPSTTSQGGIGFVTTVHTEERKVDVAYIENAIGIVNSSPFTTEARLYPHVYATSDSNTSWSVCRCIIEFGEGAAAAVETPPSTVFSSQKRKKKRNRPKNIYDTLADSRMWLPSTVLKHLKGGKENNEAGWLQKEVEKALKVPSTPIGQLKWMRWEV